MVSAEGKDEPQCLNYLLNTSCQTMSYAITHGSSSFCLNGTFYNRKEKIGCTELTDEIHISCKNAFLKNSHIILCSHLDVTCNIYLWDCP